MQKFLDANGVQYLWEQISLQDYPNNEVLAATIQAIDDVKLDKKDFPLNSGINQYLITDSEGNKVWEDKLAYSEVKELPFIEEYVWDGTQVDFPRAMVPANAGDKVTLYIDDVPYYGVLEDDDVAWIINFDEEYTHEWIEAMPFYIAKVDHDLSLGIEMEWAVGKMSATVLTDVVHTLDNKYLGLRIQPGEEEGSMIVNGDGSSPVGYYALSLNDGVATGPRSTAIGASSSASGTYSFATAGGSAKGKCSTSLGEWTEAMADNSLTIGTHNITDENKEYLFIIGNGNKGEFNPQVGYERVYSNAHTVNKDGTGWFQKEIKVGGTNEHDENAKTVLATSAPAAHQVLTSNENGDTTWENKLCYSYRQEYQVHEGFTVPSGSKMLYGQTPDVIEPIIAGETYTVIWDNVEYTCVAREEPDSNFGVALGNLHLLESQYEDTGEPFEIIGWYQHNMAQIIMCADTAGHICGGAKGSKTHYTTIDGRYIAGGVYKGEGSQSTIIGQGHANGNSSVAINSATVDATSAFGEGFSHVHSDATHAHGEGVYTDVYGAAGHVEGYATASYGLAQHVQGMLNVLDEESRYVHIVGNGEDTTRSNAHALDWNGNSYYAGDVYVQGDGKTLEFNGAKKVATEEYVNLKITNLINSAPETLDTIGEVAKALQEHQNVADALNSAIGNKVDKTDIEGLASQSYVDTKVNELFQNVSDGKELIASAITDKGVYASEDETFQELSNKISLIPVGPPGSNIIGYVDEENDIYVSLTELENGTYTLKFEDQNGLLNDFDDIGTVEVK